MVYGIIYHIFDTTNGKCYVGQTTRDLSARKSEHLAEANKNNGHFHRALHQRPDAFVWTVLTAVSTQEELNRAEIDLGLLFDALAPAGYTMRLGYQKGVMSEVSKNKLRVPKSIETRMRMSKPKSAETRARISVARKLYWQNARASR